MLTAPQVHLLRRKSAKARQNIFVFLSCFAQNMRRQLAIKVESDQQPSTSAGRRSEIPTEIRTSLQCVQKRFLFNVDQIERRYCSNTSGLVFNLKNDNVSYYCV
jgi:hypothetical protein